MGEIISNLQADSRPVLFSIRTSENMEYSNHHHEIPPHPKSNLSCIFTGDCYNTVRKIEMYMVITSAAETLLNRYHK